MKKLLLILGLTTCLGCYQVSLDIDSDVLKRTPENESTRHDQGLRNSTLSSSSNSHCISLSDPFFDSVYTFTGINYIEIYDNSHISAIGNQFSIEFWINPTDTAGTQEVLGKWGSSGTNDDEFGINLLPKNNLHIAISGNLGNYTIDTKQSLANNEWTHVAATLSDTYDELTVYINGRKDSSVPVPANFSMNRDTTMPLRFGRYNGLWADNFIGQLSDIRLWNQTIEQDDIIDWMDAENVDAHPRIVGLIDRWNGSLKTSHQCIIEEPVE